ncbi:Vgr family protein [Chryseobacterium gallinarum]|uniref:Vgr family protein n=1 Tax=Chryseobacterium gallinarum TaxID=1324352 RepID=A0A0G3M7L1_CHRGL|nr:phage baseplate assembly protein V [Chryseobacterium gallinarum]AKK73017.1 Vgr family protein [Chryseobacterium gallinarum]
MKNKTTNADKIAENHIAGIQRVVKLDIVIEGKIIKHFKHFRLQQSIRTHHNFELTLAHDSLGDTQDHNLEEAQQFLGKRLTVVFKYKDAENESPERTFVGFITQVAFSQEKASLGNIVLKGKSPTILMDSAPHTQSFGGSQAVNTSIIADRVIKETLGSGKYDYKVDTKNASYINYSAQYKETHYNYLARLAETYGEQFYYDGEVLHFGKLPPGEQPIRLTYGSNVSDICIELKAVHTKPEFFGYNSSKNEKLLSSTANIKHLGQLASKAYELNDGIYKTRALNPSPVNANMSLNVDDAQKSAAGSAAVEVFTVSGNTTVPFLHPGCIADIEMRKPNSNQTSYFTKLMITEVSHEVNTRGYYTGSFEAIAEGTGYIPTPEFVTPQAEPQIATVISNTDPLNQGRIQVQFDWQLHDTTHFIRMMSPDAGGTDAITQNRGFVAIPEVGDQVMVGFEYHHPDFPFAMGGMFHGAVALGGGVNNHIKSIQTRSGNKVIFNDAEGSIYIEDPSGNTYFMDGKGNITVNAPKDMTFTAGNNIKMTAGRDITSIAGNSMYSTANVNIVSNAGVNMIDTAGKDLMQSATGNIHESSDMRTEISENERNIQAKKSDSYAEKVTVVSTKENMVLQSEKTVKSQSGEQGNSH